ncbi:hypothetical protein TGAMA5MH_01618 [Trichoderma gamsii]|uniref:NACHT domain-containing protein n=1 Tax=Trichoderma gamsii TaxID=398673 RepID=A0A2K0TMC7_9HYPO|nr:hypothetical protein TGAMA5MH_01618 [Trichoderma gamsii]
MAYNRGVSLTQVHPSPGADADTDIDIIAIHGLDTKSPDTWISRSNYPNQDVNWLACPRMLPERIGPARIFTCDWPADLLEQPDLIQKTAEEFARLLLAGIKRRPLPTKTGYTKGKDRPIVFIASCLGGIILIKALVIAGHSSEYAIVRQSTRGIIFLATPFRGTSFRDVADWAEPGLRAWASIRGQKVSSLLDDVKGSTFHLEDLVRQFTQLCHDTNYPCQVVTFYELGLTSFHRKFPVSWLIPSGVLDQLVPPKPLVDSSSATLDIVTDPLPLNRRHVMMNKFNNPEDPDYQCVVGKIEEILQDIRTNSPLEEADAWIRNKHYAVDRLKIERLSGNLLPMDQCYINLAVVEQRGQGSERPTTEDAKSSPFSIFKRQRIEIPDTTVQVELAAVFNQRQERNGEIVQPRRILIRGRAGVGKTTLCKKIVHEFTQGTWTGWNELFDRILWIPLRNLKLEERRQHPAYDFEALLTHEYFSLPNNKPHLAKQLARSLETSSSRTLFLLDGLDEVSQELAGSNSMSRFLNELLEQPSIIITSRPSGRLSLNLDLELEAVGFYPDQVNNYIEKAFINPKTGEIDEKTIDKVQSFLQKHWLIQGLVRIPIQLDALCYSWNDIRSDLPETMTALYQAIELSLWKKDIVRLEKKHDGEPITADHIQHSSQQKIEEFVKDEISFIEGLAFAGLLSDTINFEPKHLNVISDRFPGFLFDKAVSSLSFLRTSSPSSDYRDRSYHFIHLTFQEYFAARYFVRQWVTRKHLSYVEISNGKINKIEPAKFFQKHKYTARYDILWRFVAGLLDAEPEEISLFFQKIEEEPLDLLGPAHQRLVMHCLSEVSSHVRIRADLEQRLSKWLIFECAIREGDPSRLAREMEFPDQALDTAFCEGSNSSKRLILRSIIIRATAPAYIINQAISWLGHRDKSLQDIITRFLQRFALSNDRVLKVIAAKIEDKDSMVRRAALSGFGIQSVLPKKIVGTIAARLEDVDFLVRQAAVGALSHQSVLSDEVLKAVTARLEDEHSSVRGLTLWALGKQSALPNKILKAIAAQLESEDWSMQTAAVGVLCRQHVLPDEILELIAARLEDEDWPVRQATAKGLNNLLQRWGPSYKRLEDIATRLKTKNQSIRYAALRSLNQQFSLSDEALEAIAAQLQENDNSSTQAAAIMALGSRSNLPNEIIQAIATQFKDNENTSVQSAAIETLASQSNLSSEILEVITAALEDHNPSATREAEIVDIQVASITTLGKQPDLSNKILYALVAQLKNHEFQIQSAAVKALRKQSSLPKVILNAIAALVKNSNWHIQPAAIAALRNQPGLSNKILNTIASQLKSTDNQAVLAAAISFLGDQPSLPNEILNAIAVQLDNDDFRLSEVAERMLRKHREFYLTLLKGPYARSLYELLLRQSFAEDLIWCVDDDGNSVINMPGDGGRMVIGKQDDMKAIIKGLRPADYPA